MENYIMLNGKRVDLTDEQIKKLGFEIKKDDYFNRRNKNEGYYYMDSIANVTYMPDIYKNIDDKRYNTANYCANRELLEQRALHETLSRLLWRFSMQNDGDKIDWDNLEASKYYVYYDCFNKVFHMYNDNTCRRIGTVYFYSRSIAAKAINEIILPFMKEHPEFVW